MARAEARRERVDRNRFPGRGQVRPPAAQPRRPRRTASPPSSPCRKAATSSAPSASCPIRAAPRFSRPVAQIARRGREPGGAGRARDHAARPERQRLSRRGRRTARPGRWRARRRAGAKSTGIERLRYTTSHPRDMTDDLIAAHRDMPQADALSASAGAVGLRPHPEGDEPQPHARRLSATLIERIRAARPDIALSADFIVGFPGETEADFEATLDVVRAVGFASAYSFKYSPRARHAGGRPPDQVPEDEKRGPAASLAGAAACAAGRFQCRLRRPHGTCCWKSRAAAGPVVGRSPYLQAVQVDGEAGLIGTVMNTHISGVGTNSLSGHYARAALMVWRNDPLNPPVTAAQLSRAPRAAPGRKTPTSSPSPSMTIVPCRCCAAGMTRIWRWSSTAWRWRLPRAATVSPYGACRPIAMRRATC